MAGLGNPGREYAFTRHNVGFIVVDELARRFSLDGWRKKTGAEQGLVRTRDVLLVKPQTYMNSSGAPLRVIASWHKVPPPNLLVVVDDLDLPFGKLRMRRGGSSGWTQRPQVDHRALRRGLSAPAHRHRPRARG